MNKTTRRPHILDPDVIDNLVRRIFPNVKSWLEAEGEILSDESEQDLFDDLIDLFMQKNEAFGDTPPDWDGYYLARTLEDNGWSPNAELVETLHESNDLAYASLREEVVRWVAMNGLVPSYKVGELVRIQMYVNEPDMSGCVAEVFPASLEYSIRLDNGVTLLVPQEKVCYGGDRG